MHTKLRNDIAALLVKTGKAHHEAFSKSGGDDPEWPLWYAGYLQAPLGKLLDTAFTKSQLVYCLMSAEVEREARAPDGDWPDFYAEHFIEHFAPADTPRQDHLALYHFEGCPFCSVVTRAIRRLDVEVEMRDIFADRNYRNELVAARGQATVPVLRITSPDGEDRWMPESADIVRYLEATYG